MTATNNKIYGQVRAYQGGLEAPRFLSAGKYASARGRNGIKGKVSRNVKAPEGVSILAHASTTIYPEQKSTCILTTILRPKKWCQSRC